MEKNINIALRVIRHASLNIITFWTHLLHLKLLFNFLVIFFFCLLPLNFTLTIHFLFYFFYCLQIGYLPTQVQTKSLWTQHSIFRLIFTTCDKICTLVNLLTSFWRRCRGLYSSYWLFTYPNLRAIIFFI